MKTESDVLFNIKLTLSKGNQLKCKIDNRWYKADYLGYEGAAEYLCSQILSFSNVNDFVSYSLSDINMPRFGKLYKGCSSQDFLQNGESIITADKLLKQYISPNYQEKYKNLPLIQKISMFVDDIQSITKTEGLGEYLTKMLEFDLLTLNDDRHFNNIAFLQKQDGSFSFAPIFDNGGAFLSDITFDYPLSHNVRGLIPNAKAKPFSSDFEAQTEACIKLYGSQLKISKDIDLTNAFEKIEKSYGTEIKDRMQTVFENQKFLYAEYFSEKLIKQTLEDLSIEEKEM